MRGEAVDIVGSFRPQGNPPGADSRWWGSTVRGALGPSLKNLVCTASHRRCEGCRFADQCLFPRLWEPRRRDGRGPLHQLSPWLLRVRWRAERLEVVVRLFPPARAHDTQLRIALEAALARGVTAARVSFLPEQPLGIQAVTPWQPSPAALGHPLLVQFASPLRLVRDGRPCAHAPAFSSLLASIARRWKLASLSWDWLAPPAQLPQAEVPVVRGDVAWRDFSRRSARQRAHLTLGGLVGQVLYEGDWAAALPYLRAASLLGVGKLTTHGFGHVVFGVQHPSSGSCCAPLPAG